MSKRTFPDLPGIHSESLFFPHPRTHTSTLSSLKIMWKHFPSENMFMQHQHQKAIFLFSLMTLSDIQQHNERCCYSLFFPWSLCFHGNIISEDNSGARTDSAHGPDALVLMGHERNRFASKLRSACQQPFREDETAAASSAIVSRQPGNQIIPFNTISEGAFWHSRYSSSARRRLSRWLDLVV